MKFALVLPEQQFANNINKCFNWFQSTDITRDSGEALSIKQMVDKTKTDLGSNPARTFVTGLSAGGAMTAVMLADYPDIFAGGAIMAGLPFRCATTVSAALSCMDPGVDKAPAAWGDLARSATTFSGTRPTVQIWQGTNDTTVRPMNMTELVDQWTNVAGTDQSADVQDTVAGFPHSIYQDESGRNAEGRHGGRPPAAAAGRAAYRAVTIPDVTFHASGVEDGGGHSSTLGDTTDPRHRQ